MIRAAAKGVAATLPHRGTIGDAADPSHVGQAVDVEAVAVDADAAVGVAVDGLGPAGP